MQIQWYPGHMTRARRMMAENLKLIDVVVELVDARAPMATRNPGFDDLFEKKARALILNKCDLADPQATSEWVSWFKARGVNALTMTATESGGKKKAMELIERAARPTVEKFKAKGVNKTVRVMVAGIPNVGKSTLINKLAGSATAQTGDKPGVTRGKQWVKINPYLELMDTPGLLWPKFDDERTALRLAYLGSIRDEIMDLEKLSVSLLEELKALCPEALLQRYKKLDLSAQGEELLTGVCKSRGFILAGGRYDTERGANAVLDDFRSGRIARITLERPEERGGGRPEGEESHD